MIVIVIILVRRFTKFVVGPTTKYLKQNNIIDTLTVGVGQLLIRITAI